MDFKIIKTHKTKFVLILILIIGGFLFAFLPSIQFLLNFSNDDSFFYIKITYNFSKFYISTFDLVNITNGYHPLWFIILSTYFFILNLFTNFSPELYYRCVVFLILLICILTLFILAKFWENNNPSIARRQLILFTPLFLTLVVIRDYGLETHLVCLLIAMYLYVKLMELKTNESKIKYKCLLIISLFLVRIDFLFSVIPIIVLSDCLMTPTKYKRKYLLFAMLSVLVIALVYFASNYFIFDSFFTVSGEIKNSFPETLLINNINKLMYPGSFTNQFVKSIFIVLIIIVFLILKNKFRNRFQKIDFFLFAICCSSLGFIIFNLLFNKHSIKEWYVAFPSFVCSLLLVRMIPLFPKTYFPSLMIFIFIFLIYFITTRIKNPKWDSAYYYALELKKNTNENDKIFMIDLSGIIGFFSERKVINGDGLVNSFEYQNYLSSNNLKKYFENKQVNFYSTYSTEKGYQQIKDSADFYIDEHYSNKFGGYSFTFPKKSLKLKFPFYYSHAVINDKGYWYLFKIEN